MYADETGDLDFSGNPASAAYFGIGTATFAGSHGSALAQGLELRCALEAVGVELPRGFHAKNDSHRTRAEVFEALRMQAPRFDTTFLAKSGAYPYVQKYDKTRIYKLAVYMHLKWILPRILSPLDSAYVILGSLQTSGKRSAIREAVADVCMQVAGLANTGIAPCIWDAPSSWGIQVADYGLWAVQRDLEGRPCEWLDTCVKPTLASTFMPWGRDERPET